MRIRERIEFNDFKDESYSNMFSHRSDNKSWIGRIINDHCFVVTEIKRYSSFVHTLSDIKDITTDYWCWKKDNKTVFHMVEEKHVRLDIDSDEESWVETKIRAEISNGIFVTKPFYINGTEWFDKAFGVMTECLEEISTEAAICKFKNALELLTFKMHRYNIKWGDVKFPNTWQKFDNEKFIPLVEQRQIQKELSNRVKKHLAEQVYE